LFATLKLGFNCSPKNVKEVYQKRRVSIETNYFNTTYQASKAIEKFFLEKKVVLVLLDLSKIQY